MRRASKNWKPTCTRQHETDSRRRNEPRQEIVVTLGDSCRGDGNSADRRFFSRARSSDPTGAARLLHGLRASLQGTGPRHQRLLRQFQHRRRSHGCPMSAAILRGSASRSMLFGLIGRLADKREHANEHGLGSWSGARLSMCWRIARPPGQPNGLASILRSKSLAVTAAVAMRRARTRVRLRRGRSLTASISCRICARRSRHS
jgi:hypothetical protein